MTVLVCSLSLCSLWLCVVRDVITVGVYYIGVNCRWSGFFLCNKNTGIE